MENTVRFLYWHPLPGSLFPQHPRYDLLHYVCDYAEVWAEKVTVKLAEQTLYCRSHFDDADHLSTNNQLLLYKHHLSDQVLAQNYGKMSRALAYF